MSATEPVTVTISVDASDAVTAFHKLERLMRKTQRRRASAFRWWFRYPCLALAIWPVSNGIQAYYHGFWQGQLAIAAIAVGFAGWAA